MKRFTALAAAGIVLLCALSCHGQNAAPSLKWEDVQTVDTYHFGQPKVLIYHTHASESYLGPSGEGFAGEAGEDASVVSVGTALARELCEGCGIEVLQITNAFDEPYSGAYERSEAAIRLALEQYPTIACLIDLHRDAYEAPTSLLRESFTCEIGGQAAARIETVLGEKARFFEENAAFEERIAQGLEESYPGLYRRSIHYENYYYNQFLIADSILIEVGSMQNTPEEARYSARLLAEVLGKALAEKWEAIGE